jgi:hypothetical protein
MVAGSDRGDEKAKKTADSTDPLGAIHDFAGQAINSALGAVTGFDAKALVAKFPPENIASYMRGKDIDPQSPILNAQQKADLKIYTALHDSLTANIPFYDHSAFIKSMEEEIGERSKQTDNGEHRKAEGNQTSSALAETITTKTKEADNNQQSAADANPNPSTKIIQPNKAGLQNATIDEKISNGAVKVDTSGSGNKLSTTDTGIDAGRTVKSDINDGHAANAAKPDISHDPGNSFKSALSNDPGNFLKSSNNHDSGKPSKSDRNQDPARSARSDIGHDLGKSSKPDVNREPGESSKSDINQDPGKLSKSGSSHDLESSSKSTVVHDPAKTSKLQVIQDSDKSDKSSKLDVIHDSDKSSRPDISRDSTNAAKSVPNSYPGKFTSPDLNREPGGRPRSDVSSHPEKQIQPDQVNHPHKTSRAEVDDFGTGKNSGIVSTVSSGAAVNPLSVSIIKEQPLSQNKQNDVNKSTENPNSTHPQNLTSPYTDSSGARPAKADGPRETKSRSEDSTEIIQGNSQHTEFGSKRSESISWDNIVHNQNQPGAPATASAHSTISSENKSSSKELSSIKSTESINSSSGAIHQVEQNTISKSETKVPTAEVRADGEKSIRTIPSKENAERFNQLLNSHGISTIRWQNSLNQIHSETAKSVPNRQTNIVFSPMVQINTDGTKGDANHNLDPHGTSKPDDGLKQVFASGNFALSPKTAETAPFRATVKTFNPNDKRYILGSEIALAVIIAAAGATRIRAEGQKTGLHPELIPGDKPTEIGDQNASVHDVGVELNVASGEDEDSVQETSDRHTDTVHSLTDSSRLHQNSQNSESMLNTASEATLGDSIFDKTPVAPALRSTQNSKTPTIRPKTLVASTDTLVSIAEAFFFDRNVAWLIADLNQSIVKETWMDGKRIIEIKSRQQIELPLWTDIEIFYKNKPSHARPEDLITIVQQTAVDAELLNDSLRKLLDPNNS